MFERRTSPLLSRSHFARRLARFGLATLLLISGSLAIGMVGYHALEGLGWVDAFLDASMLLGGMGPVHPPVTTAGKVFAGMYALYCGLVFLVVAGLLAAPMFHRILHRFHLEENVQD